ncbi:ATPase [Thermaurantimonas aggregans]|uniref:ATPase n=1 Tax=Thermaurantimonas aggregans TaxID=2173829 RepID=A0A401XKB7_9FLAO|nr:ATP-binding protein [Thermaurantimonas aggregans]MCX8148349.1 ATP-binding protein [Thermaurantimonas aggregans]GCD77459.1 ATPase [Thermaurantimonas aggregans]
MIYRILNDQIEKKLADQKAIILFGPRQVGKTTLVESLLSGRNDVLRLNGDEADARELLSAPNVTLLRTLLGDKKILFIDEAQRIKDIGLVIKMIVDHLKGVKVIATGSSSFDLSNQVNEPLTGRKWEYLMTPLSYEELVKHHGALEEKRLLTHRMLYGYYPEVVSNPGNEREILFELANSYLYRDILTWERIQKPDRMERLVMALAFQVGSPVSYNELGQICGLDNETVEHYIDLLEKAFIIFRLYPFSRNLRNELKKSRKIYFYDNGIRNAVIKQFQPLDMRDDVGALWENFVVSERMKLLKNHRIFANSYFWRNHAKQEIDYVEELDGSISAYEFKWSASKSSVRMPTAFKEEYNPENMKDIHQNNYSSFLTY